MTAIEAIDEWEEYPLGEVIGKAGRDLFGRSDRNYFRLKFSLFGLEL